MKRQHNTAEMVTMTQRSLQTDSNKEKQKYDSKRSIET